MPENKLEIQCGRCRTVYTIDFNRMVAYYKFTVSHWRFCPVCGHDINSGANYDRAG